MVSKRFSIVNRGIDRKELVVKDMHIKAFLRRASAYRTPFYMQIRNHDLHMKSQTICSFRNKLCNRRMRPPP